MKLPRISGRECIKALERNGLYTVRQKGSHIVVRKNEPFYQLVVPEHKELDRGTLRASLNKVV
jgi:predicted RNA binding protein YcfA (HicA-like mRNA interferase family)